MSGEIFRDKNILITGATGLIGSHLTKRFLLEGANVIAMGRSKTKIEDIFADELGKDGFKYVVANVAEGLPKDFKENVDYIFHTASPISATEIISKPLDTIEANLKGLESCLEYLKKQGRGRLVVFSSATVYGSHFNAEFTAKEEDTYKADALHTPNTPYSESKRMAEVMAGAYHAQYGVDVLIVRIAYVYGYAKHKPNTAFYEFINKALEGSDIVINNSGMGKRDNIYVEDVVDALLLLLQKGISGESYNISSNGDNGNFKAIDEIADIIVRVANKELVEDKIQLKIAAENKERKPGLRLDNQKLKSLGWSPQFSLEAGIREILIRYMH